MSSKLAKAVKQAKMLSEQYPEYFHVMTKRFHKPSVVIGGWHRTYMGNKWWITHKIFCGGDEVQIVTYGRGRGKSLVDFGVVQ